MKTYEKYKPSGIEWIGDIPEHWDSIRIKMLTRVKRGASPRPIDDPKYFDDEGEFAWVRIADVSASERYLENTTQRLSKIGISLSVKRYPDDFFLSIAGTVGKPIITKIKCCIHDGFVWFPDLKINAEFLFYIFQTGLPYQGLGKLGTQLNLNTDTVGDISIPISNSEEIENIVVYLDEKTAEIDKLIANKERLIELLKEERTAIINKAVTKGINADAKLKPSGIDWLGDIPEHWEVKRLKWLTNLIQTGPFGSQLHAQDYVTGGIPVINPAHITESKIFPDENCAVAVETWKRLERHAFELNDIVIARRGEMGRCALVNENEVGWLCGTGSLLIRLNLAIADAEFLTVLLSNDGVKSYLSLVSVGSTMDNLNTTILGELPLPFPPIEEQKEIVEFIESKTNEIDSTISKIEKEIELIKEYRTALISEVVTGKIKVADN